MKLSISIATLLILQGLPAFAQCPVSDGEVVQMLSGSEAFERLSATALTKGEFETTEQFEARKAQAGGTTNEPLLIETIFDNENVKYDADNGRFIVVTYAWDNVGYDWRTALAGGKEHGIETGYRGQHGIVVEQDTQIGKTYTASNSYGASTEVTEVIETTYAIYDRDSKEFSSTDWNSEFEHEHSVTPGSSVTIGAPAVSVFVPIERAKEIKGKLNAGVYVLPKGPRVIKGQGSFSATMRNPYDKDLQYRTIVADMLCAVITDGSGTVLKTVSTKY